MLIGYLIKDRDKIVNYINGSISYIIYLLLLLLGIAVGANNEVVNNFGSIGYKAILISLGSIMLSVILSFFLYKYYFKKQ